MMSAKEEIRSVFKSYRQNYTERDWKELSDRIQKNVMRLIPELNPKRAAVYLPSTKSREIDTALITRYLLSEKIEVQIPRVIDASGLMEMTILNPHAVLVENSWGIPEIPEDVPAGDVPPDIVIVPMLGGDYRGFRVGYGKGYYDRYLSKHRSINIGLCPSGCIVNDLPSDRYDVRMNYIITEGEILRTNASY